MKLKKMLALTMAAMLAAGLTACGSSAATSAAPAAESTADAAGAPDGDGDPTPLTVAMECAYAPYNWTQTTVPLRFAAPATTLTATMS